MAIGLFVQNAVEQYVNQHCAMLMANKPNVQRGIGDPTDHIDIAQAEI